MRNCVIKSEIRPLELYLDLFKYNFGIILEELSEACSQPTRSPRYFEIQIFDFGVAPFIHLGYFYSFVNRDFSPLTCIYIYIVPVELECFLISQVGELLKFSNRSYKPTPCRQPAVNRTQLPYCLQPDCYLVCRQADICFIFALLW